MMTGMTWALIRTLRRDIYFDYVWTHDNLADTPSRISETRCDEVLLRAGYNLQAGGHARAHGGAVGSLRLDAALAARVNPLCFRG